MHRINPPGGGSRTSTIEAARALVRRGIRVIPVPCGSKRVTRSGWTDERIAEDDIELRFAVDSNIGVLCGEPSGWLVDVDLDCEEAVPLADEYLPVTSAVTGRGQRPRSHRWFS